jgi:hypothetical protein
VSIIGVGQAAGAVAAVRGVYRACAESLADDAWKTLRPAIDNAQEVLHTNATTAVLIDIPSAFMKR